MPPKTLLLQRWSRRKTARNRNSICKDCITWVRCNSIFRPMYALCGLELRPAEEMDYRLQRKKLYFNPPWVILLFVWRICLPYTYFTEENWRKSHDAAANGKKEFHPLLLPDTTRNCTITHLSVLLVCQSRPWRGPLLIRYDLWVTWMRPMWSQCAPTNGVFVITITITITMIRAADVAVIRVIWITICHSWFKLIKNFNLPMNWVFN